jgi:hypothetical protein
MLWNESKRKRVEIRNIITMVGKRAFSLAESPASWHPDFERKR